MLCPYNWCQKCSILTLGYPSSLENTRAVHSELDIVGEACAGKLSIHVEERVRVSFWSFWERFITDLTSPFLMQILCFPREMLLAVPIVRRLHLSSWKRGLRLVEVEDRLLVGCHLGFMDLTNTFTISYTQVPNHTLCHHVGSKPCTQETDRF